MKHFVCYFEVEIEDSLLRQKLSEFFIIDLDKVGYLLEEKECLVRYENETLDNFSKFRFELNIYVSSNEILLKKGLCNIVEYGIALSIFFQNKILIHDLTDDPYQWLLIEKKSVYLVEETDNDYDGVTIKEGSLIELSSKKCINLLNERVNKESVYQLSPSSIWLSCSL